LRSSRGQKIDSNAPTFILSQVQTEGNPIEIFVIFAWLCRVNNVEVIRSRGAGAQYLLVHGTADEVCAKVKELTALFSTGLIISPSHEAILPDVPLENVRAVFI